ncbi:MAG: glutaminyl-peptide cyclotransferase [Asticcacaulis sp.]
MAGGLSCSFGRAGHSACRRCSHPSSARCPGARRTGRSAALHFENRQGFSARSGAFTEGLFYDHGSLYESTGRNGTSSIRQVNLDTGNVIQETSIDSRYFGEGIAPWNGNIVGLTWRTETGFVWNKANLALKSNFSYKGEGWGMTGNAHNLIMSDGTPTVKFLDPISLKVVKTIIVSYRGQPIDQVNELEWIDGQILANIWRTRNIVRIDPNTGHITGIVDLSALPEVTAPPPDEDAVANGIAFDPVGHRIFVTGKLWPHLYQVELVQQ